MLKSYNLYNNVPPCLYLLKPGCLPQTDMSQLAIRACKPEAFVNVLYKIINRPFSENRILLNFFFLLSYSTSVESEIIPFDIPDDGEEQWIPVKKNLPDQLLLRTGFEDTVCD